MKCTDFELRLQSLFDERGTLDGDAELQAHALTCAECQALVETYELLFDGVAAHADGHEMTSEDRAVELTARHQPGESRSRRFVPWSAAAAVLVAVGLTARTWQQPVVDRPVENHIVAVPVQQPVMPEVIPPRVARPVAPTPQPPIAPVPGSITLASTTPGDSLKPVDELEVTGLSFLESPADEYAGLYRATGRSLAMMLRSIPPLHGESAGVEPVRSEHAGRSWKQLHSSIEPLSASVTEALQELFRGKPTVSPPATSDRAS